MSDTLVFNVPVDLRLELMTPVSANGMDPEGELLNKVTNKVTGIHLVVTKIDLVFHL